jgi:hypothetical protein
MCVVVGAKNLGTEKSVGFEQKDANGMIPVLTNSTALIGNFLPFAGGEDR